MFSFSSKEKKLKKNRNSEWNPPSSFPASDTKSSLKNTDPDLIIDETTIYEIDPECVKKKSR